MVDLGCGSGALLEALEDQFEARIGLDVSTRRLEQSESGRAHSWQFRQADLNGAFPLESSSVDAVIANQVIEHIVNPISFCNEIHRVLKPGGRCVVTTPNIRYLRNIARILVAGHGPRTACGETLDGAWDDGHIHYFTHRDLREIMAQIGFRVVRSRALVDIGDNGAVRRVLDSRSDSWLIREFLSGNILVWAEK